MHARDKVFVLWDIDGTLLDTGGAGVQPLTDAIKYVTKHKVNFNRGTLAGKTDFQIIDFLTQDLISISLSDQVFDEILDLYAHSLERRLIETPVTVLGNVKDVLSKLAEEPRICNGILTGNCMKGGIIKLKSGQLFDYFDPRHNFFASNLTKTRISLVKSAVAKCKSVLLIGDSPNDIEAAQENMTPIISIASGMFSFEELNYLNQGNVLQANFEPEQFFALLQKFI